MFIMKGTRICAGHHNVNPSPSLLLGTYSNPGLIYKIRGEAGVCVGHYHVGHFTAGALQTGCNAPSCASIQLLLGSHELRPTYCDNEGCLPEGVPTQLPHRSSISRFKEFELGLSPLIGARARQGWCPRQIGVNQLNCLVYVYLTVQQPTW